MRDKIVIIDYGMGNLHSIKKKIDRLMADAIVSSNVDEIENASKIILPGVGHFAKAMESLHALGLVHVLNEEVLNKKKPILGICLGMQLMAKHSEEGDAIGFGWFDAEVVKFSVNDQLKYKVPHIGWNQIRIMKESRLMANIPNQSEFYFVHSYHFKTTDKSVVLNETQYEYSFISAVEKDNIFGVQYHPEKSQDVGEKLLKNFIELSYV